MPFPSLPPGLQALADAALDDFIADSDAYQADYILEHGIPWQGLRNPPVYPANGNTKSLDMSLRPADQDEDWNGVAPNIPRVVSLETVVHEGELGVGRTNAAYITIAGEVWCRKEGQGFYATTADWYEVVDVVV